jgi:hypothetical protein
LHRLLARAALYSDVETVALLSRHDPRFATPDENACLFGAIGAASGSSGGYVDFGGEFYLQGSRDREGAAPFADSAEFCRYLAEPQTS